MAIGISSSYSEDWSSRDDPIEEVYLIYRGGKVIAVYSPKGFEASRGVIEANPTLSAQRMTLNVAKIRDLYMPNCKGCGGPS
jgi:hypothetical protein